jgi:hypothetical protein
VHDGDADAPTTAAADDDKSGPALFMQVRNPDGPEAPRVRVLLRQSDSFAFASAFASSRIAKAEALGLCSKVSGGCCCIFDVLNCEDGVVGTW